MKILICTGIYPPAVGGPAYYAQNLKNAFEQAGHKVSIRTYGRIERTLPPLFRHIYFFFKAGIAMFFSTYVIILDTFSVGLPALCAARLLGKKIIVRVGGDFLWESYIERTHDEVVLSRFYETSLKKCSFKERLIFLSTRFVLENASMCVFSTVWQKDIWIRAYGISEAYVCVIENEYSVSRTVDIPTNESKTKVFLWAGRDLFLKNTARLEKVFKDVSIKNSSISLRCLSGVSQKELFDAMTQAYAYILPSISEVSPNVVLEAIQHGLPCIVTRETGIRDRLGDIVMYIDPLNQHDITTAVLRMAEQNVHDEFLVKMRSFSYTHTYADIAREFMNLFSRIQ